MSKSRAEMKAGLMQQAEAVIDELLDWYVETDQPNLRQVEDVVLDLRQKLSEQMAKTVIEGQEGVRPVPGPKCEGCQQEMRYKGLKDNTVVSWVGEVNLSRGYYYCDHCKSGLFPPGPAA